MDNITAIPEVENTLLFYISLGAIVFAGSILLMVFLFGLSMRETVKNTKGVIGLLLMAALIPLLVSERPESTRLFIKAGNTIEVTNFESTQAGEELVVLSFNTSEPVISYIVHQTSDGDRYPVLPTYTLEKRTEHSFIIEEEIINSGKNLLIVGKEELQLTAPEE